MMVGMQPPRPNWKTLRAALWERSSGRCEVSGRPLDPDTFDAHHRRLKGMGGTSRPDRDALYNLLALDPQVHNAGPQSVHGRGGYDGWSMTNGYIVPKHCDTPGLVPVTLHDRRRVLLTAAGGYTLIKG
jgi:hypothetical protein